MKSKKSKPIEFKSFEQALCEFQRNLMMTYGPKADKAIVKIGLEPDFYENVMLDMHRKSPYLSSFRVTDAAEPNILGVTVLPRERKKEF